MFDLRVKYCFVFAGLLPCGLWVHWVSASTPLPSGPSPSGPSPTGSSPTGSSPSRPPVSETAVSPSATPASWTEAIRDDDIVVYKRARSGSPYEEVRAEAKLTAKLDDFLPFFNEPTNYKKWVYGTLESRQISRATEFDFVFYGVFKIPWPFENRELFSRVQIARDERHQQLTARLNNSLSAHPGAAGLVRVSRFESFWSVKAIQGNKVDFSIEMYAEPGGKLPPFIVNLVLSRIQLWSIKNLRRELSRPNN